MKPFFVVKRMIYVKVPKYLSLLEVSEILEIPILSVVELCENKKLISHRTLEGIGKWRIDSYQFKDDENYYKIVDKYKNLREATEIVIEMVDGEYKLK